MTDQDQGTAIIIGVGAERGTGAAVARRFAAGGLHAVLAGRTQERLEKRRDEIIAAGGSASVHVLDVRKEDEVAARPSVRYTPSRAAHGPTSSTCGRGRRSSSDGDVLKGAGSP